MYVTEGVKSYKVRWSDCNNNVSTLFVEALDLEQAKKEAEEYIPKLCFGVFEIQRIEER